MKTKIQKILLLIVGIFALPLIAKADVGMPEMYQYDVVVTNKDGARMYDWEMKKMDTIIPLDTTITINYEHEHNGVLYLDVYYKDESGFIKMSDVQILSEEIDLSQMDKNDQNTKYYTLEEAIMYKGPAIAYGKVKDGTIPKGKTIEYTYCFGGNYDPLWIYTEYNGKKGWIYSYSLSDDSLAKIPNKDNKIYIRKDKTKVYSELNQNSKVVGTLSSNQEIEYKYSKAIDPKSEAYYIETKDVKGWVFDIDGFYNTESEVIGMYSQKMIVTDSDGIEVYKDFQDTKTIENFKLPYLAEITYKYIFVYDVIEKDEDEIYKEAILLTYNGKNYWVKTSSDDEIDVLNYEKLRLEVTDTTNLYMDLEKNDIEDKQLKKGKEIIGYGYKYVDSENQMYLIEYEDEKYWIDAEDVKILEYIEVDPTEPTNPEEPVEPKKDKEDKETLTPKEVAFMCAGAAIIGALFSVVTIILINKNKKNKKETTITPTGETKVEENSKE